MKTKLGQEASIDPTRYNPFMLTPTILRTLMVCFLQFYQVSFTAACLLVFLIAASAAKSLQSCPTLCGPIDGSPPGFPVPGILQARTQEKSPEVLHGKLKSSESQVISGYDKLFSLDKIIEGIIVTSLQKLCILTSKGLENLAKKAVSLKVSDLT